MSNNFKFQASPKLGNTLVNVQGDTADEFAANLGWVETNAAKIVASLAALEAAYNAVNAVAPLAGQVASVQVQQPVAAAPTGAPAPSCRHGVMEYKPAGVSKRTGRQYNAFWACTGPRNEQCQSQNA